MSDSVCIHQPLTYSEIDSVCIHQPLTKSCPLQSSSFQHHQILCKACPVAAYLGMPARLCCTCGLQQHHAVYGGVQMLAYNCKTLRITAARLDVGYIGWALGQAAATAVAWHLLLPGRGTGTLQVGSAIKCSRAAYPTISPMLTGNRQVGTQQSLQLHVLSPSCTGEHSNYDTVITNNTGKATHVNCSELAPCMSTNAKTHRQLQPLLAHPYRCTTQHLLLGCSTTGACTEPCAQRTEHTMQASHA